MCPPQGDHGLVMEKPTLYLETTIPSYLLATPSRDVVSLARQEITRAWWRRARGHFVMFVSDVVLEEANRGDSQAAGRRYEFLAQFPVLEATSAVERLTELYARERIVPSDRSGDAAHLAFASVYRMQFLCTWNLKHLANAFALRRLRTLNDRRGLFTPQVCTPEELLGD